jgi:hypothetical protein
VRNTDGERCRGAPRRASQAIVCVPPAGH